MTKLLTRLALGLWVVGAPLLLAGCGEENKPAAPATTPATPDKGTAPAAPDKAK